MESMDHIHYLAETIGPRGSTRAGEAEAARYAERVLGEAGLEPQVEPFRSARSAYFPYLAFSGLFLLSELFFLLGGFWGAIAAVLLALFGLLSILLELVFRPNPIRWLLPKGDSQNVWARLSPQEPARQKVVMLGHLDSHRTPLIFSSQGWLKFFGTLVPLGLGFSVFLITIFGIGILSDDWLWRVLSLPFSLLFFVLVALMIQADLTPYSAGANDNASGAALVLSTALRLKDEPLLYTEVWSVLTGCEEVACYGADAFARAHRKVLGEAIWLTVDSVGTGAGDPTYTVRETFLLTSHSDPDLVKMAGQTAKDHPELRVKGHVFKGAYSEGAIGAKHNCRVLSFGSSGQDGGQPEWHRKTDVVGNVDSEVVGRCERFIWEVLQAIDKQ